MTPEPLPDSGVQFVVAPSQPERSISNPFKFKHGHAIQTERERARMAGEKPNFAPLIDFDHLNARLRQNSVQEKLSALWVDYLLRRPATAEAGSD